MPPDPVNAVDVANPDDPNRDAYDDLLAAILASEGQLSLLMAVCDDPQLRSDLIRQYETELGADYRLYRVQLAQGEPSLKTAILTALSADPPQPDETVMITVTGIESLSFLKLGNEKSEQDLFFGYLQWTREALRELRFPIVIWVTYQILTHLSRKSPDFWSWRRGVFRFVTRTRAAIPAGRLSGIDQTILGLDRLDEDTLLPLADLQALIQQIEQQNPKDPLLASLYSQMGRVYLYRLDDGEAQDYRAEEALALEYLQKAVDLLTEAGESLELATSLNNLAGLYDSQGRYSEAEPLLLRALSIKEQQLGTTHPDVATSLNNLALLYSSQGRYSEAEPLYLRALSICEQQLGTTHADVAQSLNNLASLYKSQGRYSEAEPLHLRALSIREQQLGSTHPDVAQSLNNLAGLYYSQGRYSEAEPLLLRALSIKEQQLGTTHPDVATSLNNLALLYSSQGRYSEAEPLLLRALSIKEQQLGTTHPDVAQSLNNLGAFYVEQGNFEAARPLLQRALVIRERVLGNDHPRTQGTREWLAEAERGANPAHTPSNHRADS